MSNAHIPGQAFSVYGWLVCIWILVIPFQYGYHISTLNQIQEVLTCNVKSTSGDISWLPNCIPMSEFTFSAITAVFTIGGLVGSLTANLVMDWWGRKGAARISAILTSIGACFMAISSSASLLGFGRILIGVGSGIGICIAPVFISEIAPIAISGNVGVLTQLGIVLGIMTTQGLGLYLATPTRWRAVFCFSATLSVVQLLASVNIVESPAWLGSRGRNEEKKANGSKIWINRTLPSGTDSDPLLDELEARRADTQHTMVTVPQLIASQGLRKPLAIVCLAMASQQLSGINAVLYYSNSILSKSLPELGPYVSLGITVVNVMMTFPPIFLIERMGRRQLLAVSTIGALLSLFAVGLGLDTGHVKLSSVAILTFVMSFAIGLGPIPFVIIPEVSPTYAVSSLSSVALSVNWVVNFMVGLLFLPLRQLFSGGDVTKEGRVFFAFGTVLFVSTFALFRIYRN